MTLNLNGRITLVGSLWLLGCLPLRVFVNLLPVEWGRCGVVCAVCCRRRVVAAMWHKVIAAGIGLAACVEGVECRVDMNGWRRNGADDALNSLLNVGMSGRPSVLKSMAGTAPYLPNDSRTAASRIGIWRCRPQTLFQFCRVNVDIDACGVNLKVDKERHLLPVGN